MMVAQDRHCHYSCIGLCYGTQTWKLKLVAVALAAQQLLLQILMLSKLCSALHYHVGVRWTSQEVMHAHLLVVHSC